MYENESKDVTVVPLMGLKIRGSEFLFLFTPGQ
jgi:hypothetical protein